MNRDQLDKELSSWAFQRGFTEKDNCCCWEIYWATGGYSHLIFRVVAHEFGYWVIVVDSRASRGANLGTCKTLAQVEEIMNCLRTMEYES